MKLKLLIISINSFLLILINSSFCKEIYPKLVEQVAVKEPDSVLITSIEKIDFSPNNKFYLASSFMEEDVYLFDAKTDTLVQIFIPSEDLSDSIATFMNLFQYNFQCVPTTKLREMNPQMNPNMVDNNFTSATFLNDSLIALLGSIKVVKFPLNVDIYTFEQHRFRSYDIIVVYNLKSNKIEKSIPIPDVLDSNRHWEAFMQSDIITFDKRNSEFLLSCLSSDYYTDTLKTNNYYTVCRVNFQGEFLGYLNKLPEISIETGIKYRFNRKPTFSNDSKGDFYFLYNYIPVIYKENNTIFKVINEVPFSNQSLFDSSSYNYKKGLLNFNKLSDLFSDLLKIYFRKVFFGKKDDYYLWVSFKNPSDSTNRIHQLIHYSKNHQLLDKFNFQYKSENGKIETLHFNPLNNQVKIFRKGDENWIIETYNLNK